MDFVCVCVCVNGDSVIFPLYVVFLFLVTQQLKNLLQWCFVCLLTELFFLFFLGGDDSSPGWIIEGLISVYM